MKAKELIEKYKNGQRDFRQVDLEGENLAWSTLTDSDFRGANLQHVIFKGATLHRVKFNEGASLAFSDLSSAELINADLRGTNLEGANLSETQLNAIVDEQTRLPRGFQARLQPDHEFELIEDYKKQIEQLKNEKIESKNDLENEKNQSKIIISDLKEKTYDLENKLRNETQQLLLERKNIASLMKEFDQSKRTLSNLETTHSTLMEKLRNEEAQNLIWRKNIESLTKERDQLKLTLQRLEADHSTLEQKLKSLEKDRNSLYVAFQKSESGLLDLKQQIQESIQSQEKQAKLTHANQWQEKILQKAYSLPELSKLIDFLSRKRWRNADEETHKVIMKISGDFHQYKNGLDEVSIQRFPVTVLQTIDQLWLHYSQNHFGFTTQADIWEKCGATEERTTLQQVENCLGWRRDNQCLWYEKLNFSLDAPQGHLPARVYDEWNGKGVVFRLDWISLLLNEI